MSLNIRVRQLSFFNLLLYYNNQKIMRYEQNAHRASRCLQLKHSPSYVYRVQRSSHTTVNKQTEAKQSHMKEKERFELW